MSPTGPPPAMRTVSSLRCSIESSIWSISRPALAFCLSPISYKSGCSIEALFEFYRGELECSISKKITRATRGGLEKDAACYYIILDRRKSAFDHHLYIILSRLYATKHHTTANRNITCVIGDLLSAAPTIPNIPDSLTFVCLKSWEFRSGVHRSPDRKLTRRRYS